MAIMRPFVQIIALFLFKSFVPCKCLYDENDETETINMEKTLRDFSNDIRTLRSSLDNLRDRLHYERSIRTETYWELVERVVRYQADGNHYCGQKCPAGRWGLVGRDGIRGLPGNPGELGLKGKRGEPGWPGLMGQLGNPGAPGFQGSKGKSGIQGLDGLPGIKGDTGLPGEPGPIGPPGAKGKDGAPGPVGRPGPKGMPGIPGLDCVPSPKRQKDTSA